MGKILALVFGLVLVSIVSAAFIPAVSANNLDNDDDGLPDFMEAILGTNPDLWTNTDGIVYTEVSVIPGMINLNDATKVKLTVVSNNTVVYFIKHVLPANVEYVDGSGSITPVINGNTLEWGLDDLTPVSPWIIFFDVKSLNSGKHPVNIVPDSRATYGIWSGKVTGGGCHIQSPYGPKKANFGFVAKIDDTGEISGNFQYVDHNTGMNLHSDSIDSITVQVLEEETANATFTGTATVDGTSGYTFTVYVEDNGEPGDSDYFEITIPGLSYSAGDYLQGGNIQIHGSTAFGAIHVPFPEAIVEVNIPGNKPPVASFTVSNETPTTTQAVEFDASESTDPDGSIVAYKWDFNGDSDWDIVGNVAMVTHRYTTNGTYTAKLEVVDNLGATDWMTKELVVTDGTEGGISGNVTWNGDHLFDGLGGRLVIGEPRFITATAYEITNNVNAPVSVTVELRADGILLSSITETLGPYEQKNVTVSGTWVPMRSGMHHISLHAYDGEYWIPPTNDPTAGVKVFIEKVTS